MLIPISSSHAVSTVEELLGGGDNVVGRFLLHVHRIRVSMCFVTPISNIKDVSQKYTIWISCVSHSNDKF